MADITERCPKNAHFRIQDLFKKIVETFSFILCLCQGFDLNKIICYQIMLILFLMCMIL